MLRNKERKLLVEAREKGYKSKELSEIFNISVNSVNRIIRQKKRTGSCELKTHNSGRKSILNEVDLKNISELIEAQPDITINEIIEKLNLKAVNETVRKAVIKMGYVYKKKSLCASERERPRCSSKKKGLDRTAAGLR